MSSVGNDFSYESEDGMESYEVSGDEGYGSYESLIDESADDSLELQLEEVKPPSARDEAIKLNKRNSMIGMGILIGVVIVTSVVLSVATFGGLGVVIGAIAFTLLAFGGAHLLMNGVFGPRQVPDEDSKIDNSVQGVEEQRINDLSESSSSEEYYVPRRRKVKKEEDEEDLSFGEGMIDLQDWKGKEEEIE